MRESSPTSPTKTARSAEESNLPFGLGKGHVELLAVARPEHQLPSTTTKVARPERLSPAEAIEVVKVVRPELSQGNLDSDTGVPDHASPATVVMSPGSQAQVARWKAQSLLPKIVPPGHEPEIGQRRMVPPTTAAMPISGRKTPIVKAAMPSVPGETMMLCPQEIAPVRYEAGEGQPTTSLMSLGQVASGSHGSNHGLPNRKEVFTDTVMEENLEDEGEDFQTLLEDGVPNHMQSPLPFRGLDAYDIEISYSSEDSTEVFTSDIPLALHSLSLRCNRTTGRKPKTRRKPTSIVPARRVQKKGCKPKKWRKSVIKKSSRIMGMTGRKPNLIMPKSLHC
jgi:hypothetical protein